MTVKSSAKPFRGYGIISKTSFTLLFILMAFALLPDGLQAVPPLPFTKVEMPDSDIGITRAQTPLQHTVRVTAAVQDSPPAITLNWPIISFTTSNLSIYRKSLSDTSWGAIYASVPAGTTSYTDANVSVGVGYEYQISIQNDDVYGYAYAGINLPLVDNRGKVILLVDTSMASQLSVEIQRLQDDLAGDGWTVLRHNVARQATTAQAATASEVSAVKRIIEGDYNADPDNVKAVFILGRVPVPYSGCIAPDGHGDHVGAWPADIYYAQFGEAWTDTQSLSTNGRNANQPRDGKFDNSNFNESTVKLAVGRVDMSAMPAFSISETELLRRYLNKDHDFRQRAVVYQPRCVIDDNFGEFGGEAFAQNGWRLASLVGAENTMAGDFFTGITTPTLWGYGCGGGNYSGAGGVGSTADFASKSPQAVFTMLFGSYFGDYDSSDNFMRACLASSGAGLTCVWGGRGNWYFHHMGMGEPIGTSVLKCLTNMGNYRISYNQIHRDFLGDPTLRMHILAPPSGLRAFGPSLSWSASPDAGSAGFQGYHVYRAASLSGPFVRVTDSAVAGTSWTDPHPPAYSAYQVRAVRLETSVTGTYYNNSQGISIFTGNPVVILTSTSSVSVPEGGISAFQVRLSGMPPVDIKVNVAKTSGDSDITVAGGATLTFTPADWNMFQTVTLAAAQDNDATNGSAIITCSSPGCSNQTVTVNEIEDDITLTVTNDGNGTTVPSGNIGVGKTENTALAANPNAGYHFLNWTVESGNALFADANSASTTVRITDPATVRANFEINSIAIIADPGPLVISEGSTNTFRVKLSVQPADTKTVTVFRFSGDGDIRVISGANLIFSASTWDLYQTVTLAAAEDADTVNGTAVIRCSSPGMADMDMTATELENNYSLTVNSSGIGTTIPSGRSAQTMSLAVPIAAKPGSRYHFVNWSATSGSVVFQDASSANTTVTADADAAICANFAIDKYVVTFDLAGKGTRIGGGELIQDVAYGAPAETPLVRPAPGWALAGWNTTFDKITCYRNVKALWENGPPAITGIDAQHAVVGVSFSLPLIIESGSGPVSSVSVTGLPSGLKYDAKTKSINGVPLVPVTDREISITANNASRIPAVSKFLITVDPLPAWASGTFNGYCTVDGDSGTAAMSVTPLGALTGKLSVSGLTYSFGPLPYDSGGEPVAGFSCTILAKAGINYLPLTIKVSRPDAVEPAELSIVEGGFAKIAEVKMYRNVWKDDNPETMAKLEPHIGYYTAVLPGGAEYGSGYLTLTVDKFGNVKTAGKLADGTALLQSGALILDEAGRMFTVIYASPPEYRKGCLFGLAEFVVPQDGGLVFLRNLDAHSFIWENHNLEATATYGAGFHRELKLSGGFYDITANLYDSFQSGIELSAAPLNAPQADILANPSIIKSGLRRATGIFKGSCKASFDYGASRTASKTVSYEGVMIPERQNKDDGIEGRGFFLLPDKAQRTGLGNDTTYPFKWSYDIIVRSE